MARAILRIFATVFGVCGNRVRVLPHVSMPPHLLSKDVAAGGRMASRMPGIPNSLADGKGVPGSLGVTQAQVGDRRQAETKNSLVANRVAVRAQRRRPPLTRQATGSAADSAENATVKKPVDAAAQARDLKNLLLSQPKKATPSGGESDGGDLPRRLLLGGALAGLALGAVKRFGVDGGMDELKLAPGSLRGRTIVITGANTGLGKESAQRLAAAGATVVITARTDAKGQPAEESIKAASGSDDVHYLQLDLADLASVKSFAERFSRQPYGDRIDVLMNNAGVMAIPERLETKDGFERQLGVNHLGHFALVGKLLPLLRKAKDGARVIAVSSTAHLGATKELMEGDLMAPERYTQWGSYCQSKLANVLFAKELDRRFKASGIKATAVSLHPGGVDTDLPRYTIAGVDDPGKATQMVNDVSWAKALKDIFTRTVQLGANTQIYLAAGLDGQGRLEDSGGEYFDNMKPGLLNPVANDDALAKQLWETSESLTGVKFDL